MIGIVIKDMILETADNDLDESTEDEEIQHTTNEITYVQLLSNTRIFFASTSVFFALFQYTFIELILAESMTVTFSVEPQISGYFFLSIAVGNLISSLSLPFILDKVKNYRL